MPADDTLYINRLNAYADAEAEKQRLILELTEYLKSPGADAVVAQELRGKMLAANTNAAKLYELLCANRVLH